MTEAGAVAQLAAIGVVIPAHDEAELLPACLRAVHRAALHPAVTGIAVGVIVVLDACGDDSAGVVASEVRRWASVDGGQGPRLRPLVIMANNVGIARAAGCAALVDRFTPDGPEHVWLASTDGDSVVPYHWLAHQIEVHGHGAQAWAGTVVLDDDGEHPPEGVRRFGARYRRQALSGHHHEHGTNLGFTVDAYLRAGGFRPLPTGEDRDLLRCMRAASVPILSGLAAPVRTSSRRNGRAPDGFAAALAAGIAEL